MILVKPAVRNDQAGQGHYGARRGTRLHNGIDFHVAPGSEVLSPVAGVCTKKGRPYTDGPLRYVEITDGDGYRHRLFYVLGSVRVGADIRKDQVVGTAQDVTLRYPDSGMLPHVHYEVMVPGTAREWVDPSGDGWA